MAKWIQACTPQLGCGSTCMAGYSHFRSSKSYHRACEWAEWILTGSALEHQQSPCFGRGSCSLAGVSTLLHFVYKLPSKWAKWIQPVLLLASEQTSAVVRGSCSLAGVSTLQHFIYKLPSKWAKWIQPVLLLASEQTLAVGRGSCS